MTRRKFFGWLGGVLAGLSCGPVRRKPQPVWPISQAHFDKAKEMMAIHAATVTDDRIRGCALENLHAMQSYSLPNVKDEHGHFIWSIEKCR